MNMQKKFLPDYWQVNIDGISVWSYFRFCNNDLPTPKYSPSYKFSLNDVSFFLRFLFLRLSTKNAVFFVAARNELISLSNQINSSLGKSSLIFLREDGHGIKGNVFFLEVIRFLFRKTAPFLFRRGCSSVLSQLIDLKLDIKKFESNISVAVGDYYFNKFIAFFLKGKHVYFSNCVIPKIERTQALHLSIELQHGVIHDFHPDYANLIDGIFNVPLMCWGGFWKDKIINSGFKGELIIGEIPKKQDRYFDASDNIVFFSTISTDVSDSIMEAVGQLDHCNVFIQPHPRDLFFYNIKRFKNVRLIKGMSPVDCHIPIMNDSTLIYFCVCGNKSFIYLASSNENRIEIETRLFIKYGAVLNKHYKIADNVTQLLTYITI